MAEGCRVVLATSEQGGSEIWDFEKTITGSSDLDYWRWSDAAREEEQTKLGSRPACTKTRKSGRIMVSMSQSIFLSLTCYLCVSLWLAIKAIDA